MVETSCYWNSKTCTKATHYYTSHINILIELHMSFMPPFQVSSIKLGNDLAVHLGVATLYFHQFLVFKIFNLLFTKK
jgi:hypothetical protein